MDARVVTDEDLDNEFRYWMRELLAALKRGALLAVVVTLSIALLSAGGDSAGYAFARDFWPYLAEVAFWFGMLVTMLWSAAKRVIGAMTGVMPWEGEGRSARFPEAD